MIEFMVLMSFIRFQEMPFDDGSSEFKAFNVIGFKVNRRKFILDGDEYIYPL